MMDELTFAVTLVETGQYEEGLKKIKDILPNADDETAYQIASLYEEWGMADEAYAILSRLSRKHSGDSHILLSLAEAAIDMDREDEAIESLLKIHPLDENYLSAQVLLADLYQAEGLEESALRHLMLAKKQAPKEPIIDFALAEFYFSFGYYGKAETFYKSVLNAESLAHENISLKLAEALSLNGKFEEALIYYKKGLDKEKTLDGLFGYAVTAMRVEKYETAIAALNELKSMDPSYSTLYPVLAEAYEQEKAFDEALFALEEGLKVDEHNERLLIEASEMAMKVEQPDKAEIYLTQLLELDPEHTDALKKLLTIKKEAGKNEDIILMLTKDEIDDPEILWYLADAYSEEDELEKAIEVFEEISDHYQSDPDFLESYGQVLWEAGKSEQALTYFEKALKIDGNNDDLRDFVERIKQEI
ncbi:MAG: tetratricopeptide repeat protein [Tuberibacillus sp.]